MAQSVDGRGLGRWAIFDPRNRNYDADRKLTTLNAVRWDSADQPVLDQGEVGACTGFAVANILNTPSFEGCRRRKIKSGFLSAVDGLSFYHGATVLDGFKGTYPPVDTGSTGTSAARAAKKRGFWDYYGHTFSFSAFLANLQRQPVMMGTLWSEGMSDPNSKGVVRVTGGIAGGHEWMACRYDPVQRMVGGLNQWTREWGFAGRFWIPVDDMQWLLEEGGDVVVPRPA